MFYAKADNQASGSSIAIRARDAGVAAAKAAAATGQMDRPQTEIVINKVAIERVSN